MEGGKFIIRTLSPDKNECRLIWEMVMNNRNNLVFWRVFRRALLRRCSISASIATWVLLWALTGTPLVATLATIILWTGGIYTFVHLERLVYEGLCEEEKVNLFEHYNRRKTRFWVAEYDGGIIGSVAVDKNNECVAELKRLSIQPDFRRLGVGKTLVDKAVDFCKKNDYKELVLTTTEFHFGARRFYKQCGFKEMGVFQAPAVCFLTPYKRYSFSLRLDKNNDINPCDRIALPPFVPVCNVAP